MPDLLLELFSEEIPARMQRGAMENLKKLVTDKLVDAGLTYDGAKAFATPRRIALAVHGLPARQPDRREEKKGPRVGAPDQAVQGFLKSAGLKSIGEAKVQPDKKGDFYFAVIERKGRPAAEVIAEIIPEVVRAFPWPKSMRWGARSAQRAAFQPGAFQASAFQTGPLHWVRPLHSILCTFGPETEEPEIVKFEIDGIKAGDITHGHRVHAPGPIKVKRLEDYLTKLHAAKVVPDPDRRKATILADAKDLALAQGLDLVEDEGLLEEVAGLVEWPVVLIGSFDAAFLGIPPEVIRATIRNNQKCFVLRTPSTSPLVGEVGAKRREGGGAASTTNSPGPPPPTPPHKGEGSRLANKFITVANQEATDGGEAIKAGNARVIRARLSDAKFFWEQDRKKRLEERLPKLKEIVFHEKLGTQAERVERIARLAKELAPIVKADPQKAEQAARLAKADLVTDMVGEFPELQGTMGKYYALAEGIDPEVAAAIEEHYKPQGPSDRVPTAPVSIAVALADKIDVLVGFNAAGEIPTGSRDPYGLRRAELGVIRILETNSIKLDIREVIEKHYIHFAIRLASTDQEFATELAKRSLSQEVLQDENFSTRWEQELLHKAAASWSFAYANESILNLGERLIVQLRARGIPYDVVEAVISLGFPDRPVLANPLLAIRRVEALGKFLDTDDGKNLLVGYRRAANILRDEEKKDKRSYAGEPDPKLLQAPEEKALAAAISKVEQEVDAAIKREDFAAAMTAIAKLRAPVDAFFEKVTVNAEDKALRENRLKLLDRIRAATRTVADFSRIEG